MKMGINLMFVFAFKMIRLEFQIMYSWVQKVVDGYIFSNLLCTLTSDSFDCMLLCGTILGPRSRVPKCFEFLQLIQRTIQH